MTCRKRAQRALAVGIVAALATGGLRSFPLAAAVALATVKDDGWSEVHARDGVRVSARPRAGSAFQEMRGISDIDVPPERILAVLTDIEHYPQVIPPTTAARLLERVDGLSYYYMEISPPLISRRDYCIRVGMERLAGGILRSYWTADNSACLPEQRGVVRVRANEGEWLLEPLDSGRRTRVTYRCHIEVGGHVPAWIVNRASMTQIPNIFASVRKAASQPRYAAAKP